MVNVYDVDRKHRLVRTFRVGHRKKPRGVAAQGQTLFISSEQTVAAFDLATDRELWRTTLDASPADRLDVGRYVYVPSGFASDPSKLFLLDPVDGHVVQTLTENVPNRAHNCFVLGPNLLLSGLGSPWMGLYDEQGRLQRKFGFSDNVRPYVVDSQCKRLFANLDHLLGFEVADFDSGRVVKRIELDLPPEHKSHHNCPSHGIAIRPDDGEVWIVDDRGDHLLCFDATKPDYPHVATMQTGYDPGWVTFSPDGRFGYASTGEVFEARTHKQVAHLNVVSEKMLPLTFQGDRCVEIGSQYGTGFTRPSGDSLSATPRTACCGAQSSGWPCGCRLR